MLIKTLSLESSKRAFGYQRIALSLNIKRVLISELRHNPWKGDGLFVLRN